MPNYNVFWFNGSNEEAEHPVEISANSAEHAAICLAAPLGKIKRMEVQATRPRGITFVYLDKDSGVVGSAYVTKKKWWKTDNVYT